MQYKPCRWYDPYPGLTFVLKLIRLLPADKQAQVGVRLNQFLNHRQVQPQMAAPDTPRGNRWYDDVETLVDGLERMKEAPPHVKQQGTDFLLKLLEESDDSRINCA